MIINQFSFHDKNLNFIVGVGSFVKIGLRKEDIFNLIDIIQSKYENVIIQFFNRKLILNIEHIFYACYYSLNAFNLKTNISSKIGIEFLLYLSANRQIKKAIKDFGITDFNLNEGLFDYCIISFDNNLESINQELIADINAKETEIDLEDYSIEKLKSIIQYFGLKHNQIISVLKSYGLIIDEIILNKINIKKLIQSLEDLICEKMVLLSLEKVTQDQSDI